MIQTTEVARDELIGRLRAIAAERDSTRVSCAPMARCPMPTSMQIMGALNRGGFSNIGLVTDTGGPALDAHGRLKALA